MPTFRYRYAAGDPPAPSVLLNLTHPLSGSAIPDVPGLLDTGADQTVIPARLVTALDLLQLDVEVVQGFDGSPQLLGTYIVLLQVRDLPPVEVEAIASPRTPYVIVGRDVINRYTVTLDGPGSLLSVSDDRPPSPPA